MHTVSRLIEARRFLFSGVWVSLSSLPIDQVPCDLPFLTLGVLNCLNDSENPCYLSPWVTRFLIFTGSVVLTTAGSGCFITPVSFCSLKGVCLYITVYLTECNFINIFGIKKAK